MSDQKESLKKTVVVKQQVKSPEPKLNFREQMSVLHHCFKLKPVDMKRDLSWQKGIVKLDSIAHGHYYHSCNSWGQPQKNCNAVGGHFHEVTWSVGESGDLVAKCGPAMKKVTYKAPSGMNKTKIVPIEFYDGENQRTIVDNHTHEIEYIHSNKISLAHATDSAVKAAAMETEANRTKFENSEVRMDVTE